MDLLTTDLDRMSSNSNNKIEETKPNKVQENITIVKSNTNANPNLFGANPSQSNNQAYNPFYQTPIQNANNAVKTPPIFVDNNKNNTANNYNSASSNNNNNINMNSNNNAMTNNKNNNNNSFDKDKFIDKTTDKAFDALWENEKFQKGLKDGAKNVAYNVVANKVPIKGEPGVKHPLGAMAEKMTEKALENDKVQQSLKDAAKNATKDAIKKEVKPAEKKKGGLFGFI